jgi:hypothetical protein
MPSDRINAYATTFSEERAAKRVNSTRIHPQMTR